MAKGKLKPRVWIASWGGIAFEGRRKPRTMFLFTVAATKEEAEEVFRDGLMGLPGCEGGNLQPTDIQQEAMNFPGTSAMTAKAAVSLGYQFIVPYKRLKRKHIGQLVALLTKG